MIPILFSSFHPNEPENHMNLVSNHGGGGGGTPFLFLALTTAMWWILTGILEEKVHIHSSSVKI